MLSEILDEGLNHISGDVARIAKRELMRTIPLFYESEIKKLQHFKDSNLGLYAMDSHPRELLSKFWNSKSDACPLESDLQEKQILGFREFTKEHYFRIGKGVDVSKTIYQGFSIIIADEGFDVFEIPLGGGNPQFVKNVKTLSEAKELCKTLI